MRWGLGAWGWIIEKLDIEGWMVEVLLYLCTLVYTCILLV